MEELLKTIIALNESEELLEEIEDMDESTVDFPSEDLPLDIWDKVNDTYILKPDLKAKILDALGQYPDLDLVGTADKIHIVGSIGTDLYDEDADIDIHVTPKQEVIAGKSPEELEEMQRAIMNWFKNERESKGWFVASHPFETYFQLDPNQDYFSDTVYDLLTDTWVKPPKKYGMDYNPYTAFGDVFTELDEAVAPADLLLGKLKRLVYDFNRLSTHNAEDLATEKLEAIKVVIESLKLCKESWRTIRRRNSGKGDSNADPAQIQHSQEWSRDNLIFKFIDRYKYMATVNSLSELIKDDNQISANEIPQIEDILQNFY